MESTHPHQDTSATSDPFSQMNVPLETPDRQTAIFRSAGMADLDGILAVEQGWHEEGRAGADKFISRLKRFPQGFFVGCVIEDSREKIVATVTSMPMRFDPAEHQALRNWDTVTNNGYLFEDMRLERCNALYIASGIIDSNYRGQSIFEAGVDAEVRLARHLGLRYVVAGAVLPGYKRYCEKHGQTDAYQYCTTRRGKHLVDPLLAMYENIGFSLRAHHHVIAEYFPDDASRNFAAVVVRDLQPQQPS
jgi:hypothetical protein